MKSSPVVISITGERGGLILVTSCHAQELIFENVPKLVKIFIGVSLVIFEKTKVIESKRQLCLASSLRLEEREHILSEEVVLIGFCS